MANTAVVYGRDYGDKTLNFEASGGLMHASLVMQDKETDSYWSIMTGDSLSGDFKGTRLVELPIGAKMQWKDWLAEHPDTRILSVNVAEPGEAPEYVQHEDEDYYSEYFSSEDGFRGTQAADGRLPTKEPIYSFQLDGQAYAVPLSQLADGSAFEAAGKHLFLYRPKGVAMFYSTLAYQSSVGGFEQRAGAWRHAESGAIFDPDGEGFEGDGGQQVSRLDGFDTFWYNWSLTHPETEILR